MAEPTVPLRDFYVYALFRETGQVFYIGKGRRDRINHHHVRCNLRKNSHKNNIIRKVFLILGDLPRVKIAEELTEAEAHQLEIRLIAALGRWPDGPLSNHTDGGEGIVDSTGEIGRKISAAAKGRPVSEEMRAILRIANLGKKASLETRAKQSAAATGRVRTPEHNAKLAATKRGKKRPPHVGKAISEAKKGKKLSPEHAAKGAAARLGSKRSDETKARMAEARRAWWQKARAVGPLQIELFASSETQPPDSDD